MFSNSASLTCPVPSHVLHPNLTPWGGEGVMSKLACPGHDDYSLVVLCTLGPSWWKWSIGQSQSEKHLKVGQTCRGLKSETQPNRELIFFFFQMLLLAVPFFWLCPCWGWHMITLLSNLVNPYSKCNKFYLNFIGFICWSCSTYKSLY